MSNVKVKPNIDLMTRLLVLHHVTQELAKGFGLDVNSLETLRKGIVDQQLLQSIYIYYKNQQGDMKTRIILEIDWEKHQILAGTEGISMLRVDETKSIKDQISEIYEVIVTYIQDIKKTLKADVTGTVFILRKHIENNPTEYDKAIKFLKLHVITQKEWDAIKNKGFAVHMAYQSSNLKELNITIGHDKT